MENILDNNIINSLSNNSINKIDNIFKKTEPYFFKRKIISKAMKNVKDISLKTKRAKEYSFDLRNEYNKKMEKKSKLFEKEIYTPLYIQIHNSIKDIYSEIKTAQKYIKKRY